MKLKMATCMSLTMFLNLKILEKEFCKLASKISLSPTYLMSSVSTTQVLSGPYCEY